MLLRKYAIKRYFIFPPHLTTIMENDNGTYGKDMFAGMPDDFLPSAGQKRLNRSRCHLGCGLG